MKLQLLLFVPVSLYGRILLLKGLRVFVGSRRSNGRTEVAAASLGLASVR
jgi:hypothetical protein